MTGIAELWELAMDAINSNQEMALGASFVLGMAQASTGIDIEDDVISWMNGEVSLGLIEFEMVPGTFGDEPSFSGIALFQHEDEAAVEDLLDSLASAADEYGIELDEDSVAGQDAIILGAGGMMDVQGIEPAILIHGNYLLLAANADAAEDSIAARDGDTDSLADSDAYRRATEFVSDNLDYAAYVDIAAAVDAYLDMASDFERDDFEENAGPVIEQMESLFIGSTYNEDLVRMEVVVTLKKP
jgi:hypothetical protein